MVAFSLSSAPSFCDTFAMAVVVLNLGGACPAQSQSLKLDRKIPLGEVLGRIDHMTFDTATGRLFVAELGNDSVGVVNVNTGTVIHRIRGVKEPQGVAYLPARDLLAVASGGTGDVVAYRTADFAKAWTVSLGSDADNIRVDDSSGGIMVGYGSGLAVLDGEGRQTGSVRLPGHPEGFQIAADHVFVNVPSTRRIVVVDRGSWQVTPWSVPARGNFPMALDPYAKQVISVFRDPPRLGIYDWETGAQVASAATCGDSDDVWIDQKRNRLYVSCGEGHVAVLSRESGALKEIERLRTVEGARTSLFSQAYDLYFVAVRARGLEPAAIWVFRAGD